MTTPTRILIVANRTSSTPMLLEEVKGRAQVGAAFTLLIPPEKGASEGEDWSLDDALALLGRAADQDIDHLDCGPDAFDTIHRAVDERAFDEVILCTPQEHLSRLIHHDLRHRLEHLGLPVLVIPPEADAPLPDHLRAEMPGSWSSPPPSPGSWAPTDPPPVAATGR
jgi:hypothetical protein